MINPCHSLLTSHSNEVWEKKKKKKKRNKELKLWLKLNQRKNICFFVTVATIPPLKMTHLLLAGLPRWHIFCQLVLLLSREINVATPRAVGKNKTKNTHTRKTDQQQIWPGREESEKAMAENKDNQFVSIVSPLNVFFHAWHWSHVFGYELSLAHLIICILWLVWF